MRKIFVALTVLLVITMVAGCALNEKGYGIRGGLPGDIRSMQIGQQPAPINDPAMLQLIEMNKTLIGMLQQKQNGPITQSQPEVRKLTPEALGEKKSSASVNTPVNASVNSNVPRSVVTSLDGRLKRVERIVDNYYPGKDGGTIGNRTSKQIVLSSAATNYLAKMALKHKNGLITITGINSYYTSSRKPRESELSGEDYATSYLAEVKNYLKTKGVELDNARCVVLEGKENSACLLFDKIKRADKNSAKEIKNTKK